MTNDEFIAWFQGFTKRIKGRPTKKDWAEIAQKVEDIQGASTIKAWFLGLTSKIKGVPSDKDWRAIKDFVEATHAEAAGKQGRLKSVFDTFENNAAAISAGLGKKAK